MISIWPCVFLCLSPDSELPQKHSLFLGAQNPLCCLCPHGVLGACLGLQGKDAAVEEGRAVTRNPSPRTQAGNHILESFSHSFIHSCKSLSPGQPVRWRAELGTAQPLLCHRGTWHTEDRNTVRWGGGRLQNKDATINSCLESVLGNSDRATAGTVQMGVQVEQGSWPEESGTVTSFSDWDLRVTISALPPRKHTECKLTRNCHGAWGAEKT